MTRGPIRYRSLLVAGALLLAGAALPATAEAQYFGRNKVQYESFDFEVLKTEHFDIYYYDEGEEVIREAARMAERWYARIARLLDHQLRGQQPLILYVSHPHFEQTNAIFGEIGESTGGVTEVLKRRIVLPLAGPLKESDHVLGHELVHAFQFDITAFSGDGGVGFRGPTALLLPLWFIEGMAEYLSVGPLDAHTAMWMRDAASGCCELPTLMDLTQNPYRYFPYRWGQAFWAFVAGNWGDEAIGKILKVAGRNGNTIGAIEAVLQVPVDSLTAEWHRAIIDMYAEVAEDDEGALAGLEARQPDAEVPEGEEGDRPEPLDDEEMLAVFAAQHGGATPLVSKRTGAGGLNVGPALSPDGSRVVFLSEKDLFSIEMFLADAQTGEVIRRLTKAASDPHFESLQFINSSGAWSYDSRHFAYAFVTAGRPAIIIIEAETGKKVRELRFETLGEIFTPTFSPDGRSLAFSAIVNGYTDLFVVDIETEELRRLTSDMFADLQPAWSPDGAAIAFVTDRFSSDLGTLEYGNYRLAIIDPATSEIQALPVFGVGKHIDPQWSADGQSIYFVTDVSGISNVYRFEFQGGNLYQVTDLNTGVSGITALSPAISAAAASDKLVYTAFEGGDYNLYAIDDPARLEGEPIEAAIAGVSPAMLPPQDRSAGLVSVLMDEPELGLADTLTFTADNYRPGLALDYVSQPQLAAGADRYGAFLAGGISLFFSDMLGNRNLGTVVNINTAAGDILRSSSLVVSYQNRRTRWNWGIEAGQVPFVTSQFRLLDLGNGLFQQEELRQWQINRLVTTGVSYPFSRASRVEFGAGFQGIDFANEIRRTVFDSFGVQVSETEKEELPSPETLLMGIFTAALVYDNTLFGGTGPILGQRYRLEISPRVGDLNYYTPLVDYRRYFMPVRPTTLAFRLLGFGRFGQDAEDIRLSSLYLGYPSLMRGYNDGSYSFDECEGGVTDQGLTSCPAFDQLFGSRIAVANFEYRIPLLGFFGLIPSAGAPPVETALFFDAGVAWNRALDPTFSCASDLTAGVDCREVVTSHGIAMRVNLLGLLLMELDFVHPNNRPRGWYWQFSLVPSF
jgi:hypothetical protein